MTVSALIPNLPEPDPNAIIAVPGGFTEDVQHAIAGTSDLAAKIGDLALFADDIRGLSWETNGLRAIGRAQFKLGPRAGAAATVTWERIRERGENDVEANQVLAALNVLPSAENEPGPRHTILFTGHRIDSPGRETPRFPANAAAAVAAEIGRALDQVLTRHRNNCVAVAGAASGGDILFHEACIARGLRNVIYLAIPPEDYAAASVKDAGGDWVARFYALIEKVPYRVLHPSGKLPAWLTERPDYTLWQRNNLWTLDRGLAYGGGKMTLLSLWDGKGGDGPGGTADMVAQARARGAQVMELGRDSIFAG